MNWNELIAQVGSIDFTPLPKGAYQCVADEAQAVTASTGKPMIKVKFKVEDGPHKGRIIYNNFVVNTDNPNALVYFFRHMAIFGMDQKFFDMNPALEQVAGQIVGKRCVLTLEEPRDYQGTMQNGNVKSVGTPVGAGPVGGIGVPGIPLAPSAPAPAILPAPAPVEDALPASNGEAPKPPFDDDEEPF